MSEATHRCTGQGNGTRSYGYGGWAAGGALPSDQQDGLGGGQGGAELRPKHRGQGSGQAVGALPGACWGYGLSTGIPFSFGPSRGACSILPQVPSPQAVPGELWPGLGGQHRAVCSCPFPVPLLLVKPSPGLPGGTRLCQLCPGTQRGAQQTLLQQGGQKLHSPKSLEQSQNKTKQKNNNNNKKEERKKRCSKGARRNADTPGERQPQ